MAYAEFPAPRFGHLLRADAGPGWEFLDAASVALRIAQAAVKRMLGEVLWTTAECLAKLRDPVEVDDAQRIRSHRGTVVRAP